MKSGAEKTCFLESFVVEHNVNKRLNDENDRKARLSGNAGDRRNAGQREGFLQRGLLVVVHRLRADLFSLCRRAGRRFSADGQDAPVKPLPVLYSERLEETLTAVENAGGTIVKPIFSFPGGRQFHFVDPAGNEMAVWSE